MRGPRADGTETTAGVLEARLLAALAAAGREPDRLRSADLAALDCLHLGGAAASAKLLERLPLRPGLAILDIGCGGGNTARLLAERARALVVGVDRDPVLLALAKRLAARVGLAERTAFLLADALALPFPDAAFDGALSLHLAMAVAAKDRLRAEAFRVLRPGGFLGLYDAVAGPAGPPLLYPTPWAETAAASFVESPEATRAGLARVGFRIEAELDLTELARAGLLRLRARLEAAADPSRVPGPHLLMGQNFAEKLANLARAFEAERLRAVAFIARKP